MKKVRKGKRKRKPAKRKLTVCALFKCPYAGGMAF